MMEQVTTLNCPACGGTVELANRFVKMTVCPYCGNTLSVEDDRLDPTGKTAALVDYPTRFSVGATGRFSERPFRILGRVRFQCDDGYWDEWYLAFEDGGVAWLEEEEGELILSRKAALTSEVPPFDAVRLATRLSINDEPFFVTERCTARVAGAEGQLYYRVKPNETVRFVDGNINGSPAAIEYGDDEIEYGVGQVVDPEQIALDEP